MLAFSLRAFFFYSYVASTCFSAKFEFHVCVYGFSGCGSSTFLSYDILFSEAFKRNFFSLLLFVEERWWLRSMDMPTRYIYVIPSKSHFQRIMINSKSTQKSKWGAETGRCWEKKQYPSSTTKIVVLWIGDLFECIVQLLRLRISFVSVQCTLYNVLHIYVYSVQYSIQYDKRLIWISQSVCFGRL